MTFNKRKKQTKYNRDIEVKNNLTIARGEREGIVGRRIFRNYYKDTWTKPRGRVEAGEGGEFSWGWVEGWGDNADNYN